MVRRIVGMLVETGRGKASREDIELLLAPLSSSRRSRTEGRERRVGGEGVLFNPAEYTAPPSGLFLEKVFY